MRPSSIRWGPRLERCGMVGYRTMTSSERSPVIWRCVNCGSLIHPADVPAAQAAFARLTQGAVLRDHDLRLR